MSRLIQGLLNELFYYENGLLINKLTRGASKKGSLAGTLELSGYVNVKINYTKHGVHRVIWTMFNGDIPEGYTVDHINGVKSDNRIENLRLATPAQNCQNSLRNSRKDLPKGVCLHKHRLKYQAAIRSKGVNYYLGSFDTPEEAHIAYCDAADMLHGEFANYGD